MTDRRPAVSIVLTTYEHAPYVEQALSSVLAQDYHDYEIVITDDGSQDDSVAVMRRWLENHGLDHEVVAHERNLGLCATLNRALARATGEFVCWLDGDDWYESDYLSRMVAGLEAQGPDVAVAYCDARVVAADGSTLWDSFLAGSLWGEPPPEGWVFETLQRRNVLFSGAALVRRTAIDAVGGFDEDLMFEDWDLWLRIADRCRFHHVDGRGMNRRVLATSMEHSLFGTLGMQRSVVRLQAKWLDRDAHARCTAAWWMRRSALVIAQYEPLEAQAILHRVADIPDDGHVPWRAVEAVLGLPGARRLVRPARTAVEAARPLVAAELGAWRSGRRIPRRAAPQQ